jgi:Ca2+-binding RTX toxin-like protein
MKLVVDVEGTSSAATAPTIDLRWRGAGAVDTPTRAGSLNPDSNYTGLATSSAAIDAVNGNIEGYSGGGPVQLGSTTTCPGGGAGPCTGVAGGGLASSQGPTWAGADNVQVTGVGGFGSPFTGTSAAAPHAAACEALVRQIQPGMTVTQAIARLKSTAIDYLPAGVDNVTGVGRLTCNSLSSAVSLCGSPTPPPPGTLPGNNIVIASPGLITVGTAGNDVIYGTSGDDRIFGAGGDDVTFGGGGNDEITGGTGNDTLCGGDGNDRITGDAGNDTVVGGTGNDDLTGLVGDDTVVGGTGTVRIDGGDGNDTCVAGTGAGSATVKCETIVP